MNLKIKNILNSTGWISILFILVFSMNLGGLKDVFYHNVLKFKNGNEFILGDEIYRLKTDELNISAINENSVILKMIDWNSNSSVAVVKALKQSEGDLIKFNIIEKGGFKKISESCFTAMYSEAFRLKTGFVNMVRSAKLDISFNSLLSEQSINSFCKMMKTVN